MVPENSKVKNAQPTVIRIRFTKVGSLQFISHLDLCRTMKSALIRAKAPLWYSEGFNPHPRMTFALPLSIGTQSVNELLDVKLDYEVDAEQFRQALDAETTDEMKILECYYPENKLNAYKGGFTRTPASFNKIMSVFIASYCTMNFMKRGKTNENLYF